MKTTGLFHSFRARLLVVLAFLFVLTLGVQYYLHGREQTRRAVVSTVQQQALAASIELALRSVSSKEYLYQLDGRREVPFLREQGGRVTNILIVNEAGRVDDSLAPEWMPKSSEDGSVRYYNISEVQLPRRIYASPAAREAPSFLPAPTTAVPPNAVAPRAYLLPLRTALGLNYLVVVLGVPEEFRREPWERAVIPLLPTVAALSFAGIAMVILLRRFTQPIYDLSSAVRKVSGGDLSPDALPPARRRDEVGELITTFNRMVNDLGHMRELEMKAKKAEQSAVIGRIATAIAHDVRHPLDSINTTLEGLGTSLAPDDPNKRVVVERLTSQLKTEVSRIDARINEFIKYTRPSKAEFWPLELAAEVQDALGLVEVQAAESGVLTLVEQDGEIPRVAGDAAALRSVFTNLFINALHAMEGGEGGRLVVRLSNDGPGLVRVEVADTGKGIAAGDIEHVFEPYFSTKETGTGLGLAIVRKIVEDHGGKVSVESSPGEGATFTVLLPAGPNGSAEAKS